MLQRRVDDGLWGFIGGIVELGESFEDAARRELLDETGLTAGSLRQLDVYSGPEFRLTYPNGDQTYVVGVTFLAGSVVGVAAPDGQEGFELGWFNPDHPPALSEYDTLLATRVLAPLARPRNELTPRQPTSSFAAVRVRMLPLAGSSPPDELLTACVAQLNRRCVAGACWLLV